MISLRLFLFLALAVVAAPSFASAKAIGLTLGLVGIGDYSAFYLYHLNLTSVASGRDSTPVSADSNASTVLFYNYQPYEAFLFAPPPKNSTEWLIPLSSEAGEVVVHYDVAVDALQIDQVHGGLLVGDWSGGDIQQILWLESQMSFYAISVDQNARRGELYLSFYADMVIELQKQHPHPIDNQTLSVGSNHQVFLPKQSMAVSQKQELFFIMAEYFSADLTSTSAGLWTYDVINRNVSKQVAYRNDSSKLFVSTLVFSEKRQALYAVVAVWGPSGQTVVQLLVDQIDWTTGEVAHIATAIPFPKAGLDCLTTALDDESGDLHIVFRSIDPAVSGYVILITSVNVDSQVVRTIAELPTYDALFGTGFTMDTDMLHRAKPNGPRVPSTRPALLSMLPVMSKIASLEAEGGQAVQM